MKQIALLVSITFISLHSFSQNITGSELLNKAIKYHDPHNHWAALTIVFW